MIFAIQLKTCDNGENDGMDDKMTKTIDLQVNARNIADFKKGYPLILKDAIINPRRADARRKHRSVTRQRSSIRCKRLLRRTKQRSWLGTYKERRRSN